MNKQSLSVITALICSVHGNTACIHFMTNAQLLVNNWMELYGFSMGIEDCMVPESTNAQIKQCIMDNMAHISQIDTLGIQIHAPYDEHERNMSYLLNQFLNITGGMVQSDLKHNSFNMMIQAGSRAIN